ncbi:F5/8 type C domain containing protein [Tritrichomonas foetus]|uniref:F5/8 type C domain containing protein n=1 Tax=Tritrichomonas foetus TaxID=1144522 RepID=A0A1J4J8R9_9EUKA|nr:F5/8 type C domain containing protein [Tritrichomonas foetus]|eukprot:OHS94083.1 F5/8 type C domain containing protein [Tritrichomonas foetus]
MNNDITLSLGVENLSFLDPNAFEKDFSFIVGGSIYKCNRFFADLISPKVALMHRADPTITSFIIKASDKGSYFTYFLKLMCGETVTIPQHAIQYICKIAHCMGNTKILTTVYEQDNRSISTETVVSLLNEKNQFSLDVSREIKFIIYHFSEIPIKLILNLELNSLIRILSSNDLIIESEDWLLDTLLQLIKEKGEKYRLLYECIHFEYLTIESMSKFISHVDSEDISGKLWLNITKRLILPVYPPADTLRYTKKDVMFNLKEEEPFSGICAYLNKKCGGNAHDKGLISMSSSSIGINQPSQIIDFGWEGDWGTKNKPNSWLMFDFNNLSVELTGYSLMSIPSNMNNTHPRSWVIEATNDLSNWDVVDKREMNNDLNGKNKVKSFTFRRTSPYRYVRIRQTDLNHSHNNYFAISQMELFGSITNENQANNNNLPEIPTTPNNNSTTRPNLKMS